ncbi:unnamed protein product [Amoebophrya sp. A25]|nr:unnamed protein product [Amoebophrya sp. A25]|eukprot:GSA25T00001789001.1
MYAGGGRGGMPVVGSPMRAQQQRTVLAPQQPTFGGFKPGVNYYSIKRQLSKEQILEKKRSKNRRARAGPLQGLALRGFDSVHKWIPHLIAYLWVQAVPEFVRALFDSEDPSLSKNRRKLKKAVEDAERDNPKPSGEKQQEVEKRDSSSLNNADVLDEMASKHDYAASVLCIFRVVVFFGTAVAAAEWHRKHAEASELHLAGCYIESFETLGCNVGEGDCAFMIAVFPKDEEGEFTQEQFTARNWFPEMSGSIYAEEGVDFEGDGFSCCKATSCCGLSTTTTSTTPERIYDDEGNLMGQSLQLMQKQTSWPKTFCDNWGGWCNSDPWACYFTGYGAKNTVDGLRQGQPDFGDTEFMFFIIAFVLLLLSAVLFLRGLVNAILQDLFGIFCCCLLVEVDEDGNMVERVLEHDEEEARRQSKTVDIGPRGSKGKGDTGGADGSGDTCHLNTLLTPYHSPQKAKQTRDARAGDGSGPGGPGAGGGVTKARGGGMPCADNYVNVPLTTNEDVGYNNGETVIPIDGALSREDVGNAYAFAKNEAKQGWRWFLGQVNVWHNRDKTIADAHASAKATKHKGDGDDATTPAAGAGRKSPPGRRKLVAPQEERKHETKFELMVRKLRQKHNGSIPTEVLMRPIIEPLEETWLEKLQAQERDEGRVTRHAAGLTRDRNIYKHIHSFKFDPAFSRGGGIDTDENARMMMTSTFDGHFSSAGGGRLPTLLESTASHGEELPFASGRSRSVSKFKLVGGREGLGNATGNDPEKGSRSGSPGSRVGSKERGSSRGGSKDAASLNDISRKLSSMSLNTEARAKAREKIRLKNRVVLESGSESSSRSVSRAPSKDRRATPGSKGRAGSPPQTERGGNLAGSAANRLAEIVGNDKSLFGMPLMARAAGASQTGGGLRKSVQHQDKLDSTMGGTLNATSLFEKSDGGETRGLAVMQAVRRKLAGGRRAAAQQKERCPGLSRSQAAILRHPFQERPNLRAKLLRERSLPSQEQTRQMFQDMGAIGLEKQNDAYTWRAIEFQDSLPFDCTNLRYRPMLAETSRGAFSDDQRTNRRHAVRSVERDEKTLTVAVFAGEAEEAERKRLEEAALAETRERARKAAAAARKKQEAFATAKAPKTALAKRKAAAKMRQKEEENRNKALGNTPTRDVESESKGNGPETEPAQLPTLLTAADGVEGDRPDSSSGPSAMKAESGATRLNKTPDRSVFGKRSAAGAKRETLKRHTSKTNSKRSKERSADRNGGEEDDERPESSASVRAAKRAESAPLHRQPLEWVRGSLNVADFERREKTDGRLFRRARDAAARILWRWRGQHLKRGSSNPVTRNHFAQGYREFLRPNLGPEVFAYERDIAPPGEKPAVELYAGQEQLREMRARKRKAKDMVESLVPDTHKFARRFQRKDEENCAEDKFTRQLVAAYDGDISDGESYSMQDDLAEEYRVPTGDFVVELGELQDARSKVNAPKDLGRMPFFGYRASEIGLVPSRPMDASTTSRLLVKQAAESKASQFGRLENAPHRVPPPGASAGIEQSRLRNREEYWNFVEETWRRRHAEADAQVKHAKSTFEKRRNVTLLPDQPEDNRVFGWEAGHEDWKEKEKTKLGSKKKLKTSLPQRFARSLSSRESRNRHAHRAHETQEAHFVRMRSIDAPRKRGAVYHGVLDFWSTFVETPKKTSGRDLKGEEQQGLRRKKKKKPWKMPDLSYLDEMKDDSY